VVAVTLADIVARFGGELSGDAATEVFRVASLESAGPGDVTFLSNPKFQRKLAATKATAVILSDRAAASCPVPHIATANPYLYFARVAQWLSPLPRPLAGIDPTARVLCALPADVSVGAGSFIAAGVSVGANTIIGAGCTIAADVVIGADSLLHANVSIYAGCRIGARAIIHSGAVIGADGFGFARETDGAWVKIPQNGRVVIGDDVEIGANTTIDRGALDDTVIENGVKLDNQIQVAHNVHIGTNSALAGCVGIAGSARIGRRCTVGGAAMILGHLEIADDVHISAGTLVTKSIANAGSYTGSVPFLPHADWLKNFARLRHLDAMADKIRALEARLAELENNSS
jgi:UDP-3-O-[3-hydroxymyristoyl] glucosamine N-acyltransferase